VGPILAVTDIAGLIRGASEGAGLGNQFLSHIRDCDGIYHIVRAFDDDRILHTEVGVDPVRDIDVICNELRQKDLETLSNHRDQLKRFVNDQKKKEEYQLCTKVLETLQEKVNITTLTWRDDEVEVIRKWRLLGVKPRIILLNMSSFGYQHAQKSHEEGEEVSGDGGNVGCEKELERLKAITEWGAEHNTPVIPYSVKYEQEIIEKEEFALLEYEEFIASTKITTLPPPSLLHDPPSQIPTIIQSGYHLLQLIHYFTYGKDEVKCWSITKGTQAPAASRLIHTDFEAGFIRADVMSFENYRKMKSEVAMKNAGLIRSEGRDYVVKDGDMIVFRIKAKK
jgi:obg-like ATPase 1